MRIGTCDRDGGHSLSLAGRLPALDVGVPVSVQRLHSGSDLIAESRLRHFHSGHPLPPLPLTSPPLSRPVPGSSSHLLYAERRFAGPPLRYRHIETLPRIHRNPVTSDLLVRRQQQQYCSSGRKLDDTARAVASDLLYRYGCQAMTANERLERAASSRNYRPPQPQPQPQPALCRCESGGELPAASPPPGQFGQSSFRAAQSLPSTPNAARRPIDLPPPRSLLYSAPPDHPAHQPLPAARTFFPDPVAPSAPSDLSRPEQFLLRDVVPDSQVSCLSINDHSD